MKVYNFFISNVNVLKMLHLVCSSKFMNKRDYIQYVLLKALLEDCKEIYQDKDIKNSVNTILNKIEKKYKNKINIEEHEKLEDLK